jgi:hypothetical protein
MLLATLIILLYIAVVLSLAYLDVRYNGGSLDKERKDK